MLFDMIISEGRIVDGSGRPPFKGDLGIKEDRITAVGDLSDAEAGTKIIVCGQAVAPGFIDLHTHSDCTLLVNGAAESQVHQGVTLEVVGQCGFSAAPIRDAELGKRILVGYHPSMEHTLEMIHWARESGADVCFDIFPHDWNHTGVSTALPSWAFEGGIDRLLARLGDPQEREKMKINPKPVWQLVTAGRWNDIVLFRSQKNKDLIGLTFEEIGRKRKVDPHEAVFDLLLEEGEDLYDLMWTSHSFSEADVRLCLKQPECVIASDTMALAPYGLLKDTIGSLIGYGWTAQLFQKYVREEAVIKLEDAVHKLTGLPAQRLGLKDRGGLYPGAMADIVVFNPDTIENLATLTKPTQYPRGIEYVIVNGRTVIENGKRTQINPGRVIRRTN